MAPGAQQGSQRVHRRHGLYRIVDATSGAYVAGGEPYPFSLLLKDAEALLLGAHHPRSLMPYSADTPPLVLAPASQVGVQDRRGRFREIYCAALEARGPALPDYRPCEEALTRVGAEPAGSGRPVDLGPSKRHLVAAWVPGIGYECLEPWLRPLETVAQHLRQFGYDAVQLKVDALSSTENNARQIRDAVMAMPLGAGPPRLVLVGYSKVWVANW
jgi:hypothetical protein